VEDENVTMGMCLVTQWIMGVDKMQSSSGTMSLTPGDMNFAEISVGAVEISQLVCSGHLQLMFLPLKQANTLLK